MVRREGKRRRGSGQRLGPGDVAFQRHGVIRNEPDEDLPVVQQGQARGQDVAQHKVIQAALDDAAIHAVPDDLADDQIRAGRAEFGRRDDQLAQAGIEDPDRHGILGVVVVLQQPRVRRIARPLDRQRIVG